MIVSVGIKALNEEKVIAASIASAVMAVTPFDGEVILADSGSTDRTLEIARQFPVRIVKLANPNERSCGTGAQLAFQYALGDYFYLLDGDMVLDCAFLEEAIAFLRANDDVAAVGGHVREQNTRAEVFQIQAETSLRDPDRKAGYVDRLDGGGLYRTSAIRSVGYFADRNLHAFEEFELAVRLRSGGWKLARIDRHAVDHYGYDVGGYPLLWRRLVSGYAGGAGEVLRAALGRPHFGIVATRFKHVYYALYVLAWWAIVFLCASRSPVYGLIPLLAPVVGLSIRRGSLRLGLYSFVSWNVSAVGFLLALFRHRKPPSDPIGAHELPRENSF